MVVQMFVCNLWLEIFQVRSRFPESHDLGPRTRWASGTRHSGSQFRHCDGTTQKETTFWSLENAKADSILQVVEVNIGL